MAKKANVTKEERLIERTVQEAAQRYLENYYRANRRPRELYSNLEERTKKKYGMKRADGLLAYKKGGSSAYVVSMEAKSHKTLPALKPYRVDKLWIRDSIWHGLLFTLLTGVLFFVWRMTDQSFWIRFAIPFAVWGIASAVFALLFKNSHKYQEMKVIHQVFQYPANEKWLSLSNDSFEMIDPKLQDNLFKICKARGVGVLMVDSRQNVTMIHKAQSHRKWIGSDYLAYYLNEPDIRRHLGIIQDKKKK